MERRGGQAGPALGELTFQTAAGPRGVSVAANLTHAHFQTRLIIPAERRWSDDVFDGEQHVGRIMLHPQAPEDEPGFWTVIGRVPQCTHDRGYAGRG
jgi:hypothetical protein